MGNGQLVDQRVNSGQGTSTWVWDETEQMATYLATVNIGKFTILRSTTPSGIPIIDGVRPDQLNDTSRQRLDTIGPGGSAASTQDFVAIAQRDSGQDLREFFKIWLYQPGKPASW